MAVMKALAYGEYDPDRRDALADEAGVWDDDPPEYEPDEFTACAAYIDPDTGWLLYRAADPE
jgi:hypothetical protein